MEIEKNVPLVSANAPKPLQYPFDKKEIGDSLYFAWAKDHSKIHYKYRNYAIRTGRRFISRFQYDDDGNVAGIRVWRIEDADIRSRRDI